MKTRAGWLRLMVPVAGAFVLTVAQAQEGTKPAAAPKPAAQPAKPAAQPATDAKGDASYSIGVSMGDQLKRLGVTADMITPEKLTQGLRDVMSGKTAMSDQHQQNLMTMVQNARSASGERNKAAAVKFLAENGKKKDVVTTASGLQYRVVKAGAGKAPAASDEVTVHYRGTFLDGTEFDSSIKRGEPATFQANGVIKGWQEALVLMQPGAKWELFIPPDLAYGMQPPPSIPPGSLLHFEVELLGVKAAK